MKKAAGMIVGAAALLALVSGCAAPSPAGMPRSTKPASVSAAPSPAVAPAPTVRVPATCDQLVPETLRDAAAGVHVAPASDLAGGYSPLAYADRRAGALVCSWQGTESDPKQPWVVPAVWVGVLAGSSPGAFGYFQGEWGAGDQPDPFFLCPAFSAALCAFGGSGGGYQWMGTVSVGAGGIDADAARAVYESARSAVTGLPVATVPLWEPQGGSLRSVTSPGGFLPLDRLQTVAGTGPLHEVKSEGGEYAISALGSSALVGGFYADLVDDGGNGLTIHVLPGGAFGFDDRTAHPLSGTTEVRPAPVGDEAHFSRPGSTVPDSSAPSRATLLDVKVKNSWVQVGSATLTADELVAVARAVIANLS